MNKLTIAAAALAAGLLVQTQGFTQAPISASAANHAGTTSDPEKAARETWHAVMRNIPVPGKGCFHASYPNVAWETVDCKVTKPRVHHAPPRPTVGGPATVGDGNDYMAQAQGLISSALGKFFISGVTSETGVGGGSGSILGPNEYMLQINTNNGGSPGTNTAFAVTDACSEGHPNCSAWQQFMYATDYNQSGQAALFMQYWLLGWNATCPTSPQYWNTSKNSNGDTDCWRNSTSVPVPNIPVTNLGDVILSATAENGGKDTVWLEYGDDSWVQAADDSVLDISVVWSQAEFNVVGDVNSAQAQFNYGAQIIVVLEILDGSNSAPTCRPSIAPTGETNNANLGPCSTGVGNEIDLGGCGNQNACVPAGWVYGPYITFAENVPPYVCLACGPVRPGPPPPIEP
jgi:hypothetical protein